MSYRQAQARYLAMAVGQLRRALERSITTATGQFRRALTAAVTAYFRPRGSISSAQIKEIVSQGVTDAYYEGLKEGGVDPQDFTEEDAAAVDQLVYAQLESVDGFVQAVRDAKGDSEAEGAVLARVDLWTASIAVAGTLGLNAAKANEMVTWRLGRTEKHCRTCQWLNGQRHRRKWFTDKGYIPRQPGSEMLACGGWRCDCSLEPD